MSVTQALRPGRAAWLQVLRGNVLLNGQALQEGDGVAISEETALTIQAQLASEILLFDLA